MKKCDYKPLIEYLTKENDLSELSFEAIEEIIKSSIPKSIKKDRGLNKTIGLGRAILDAGYFVDRVNYNKGIIIIHKDPKMVEEYLEQTNTHPSPYFLNNIFPGSSYLNNDTNIGHEIIDIFGADNNEFYYYLNKNGQTNDVPKEIVSITGIGNGLYKIINKATGIELLESAKTKVSPKDSYRKQKKNFLYNGHPIADYLKNNKYNQKYNESTLVTYKCKSVVSPKYEMFIAFAKSSVKENKKRHIYKLESVKNPRALRVVRLSEKDIKTMSEIVKSSNWNDTPIPSYKDKYDDIKSMVNGHNEGLFEILNIDSQELPYSNFLKYIFDATKTTNDFLRFVFKDKSVGKAPYEIDREKFNTDLLFTNFKSCKKIDDQKIYIIENKIDSAITLSDREARTLDQQIEKVCKAILEKDNDEEDDAEKDSENIRLTQEVANFIHGEVGDYGDKIHTQLSKYYIFAVLTAKLNKWSDEKIRKDIRCALLCPEYSRYQYSFDRNSFLKDNGYILEEKYRFITYKQVLDFFEKINVTNPSLKAKFDIFIDAIQLKAKDRDDSRERTMIERFFKMMN